MPNRKTKPDQGFTQSQLEQLQALFSKSKVYTSKGLSNQKKYTDKKFLEQRKYADKRFAEQRKYADKRFAEQKEFVDKQFGKLTRLINKTRNELQQNIATLAIHSPTRTEFDNLKDRVDFYHPEL